MTKTHGKFGSPEYRAFWNAKNRCERKKDIRYQDYGGRGIKMMFANFEEFFAHIGPRPSKMHTLDRIDTNGSYHAGNVRWIPAKLQSKTKRTTTLYKWNGREKTLPAICRETGANYRSAWRRIVIYGWPLEDAVKP